MISRTVLQILVLSTSVVVGDNSCYWNSHCQYQLFSSKTPYDAVRGDIRDYADPPNCQAVSLWTLGRHGNRNPGSSVTEDIKVIAALKDEIVASYAAGRSQLCAQDIEEFRAWQWNETIEVSASFLTGVGYDELYDIGKRLRDRYPELLNGSESDYYVRPTNEQRTITSAIAFVHGLTDGTNLNVVIDSELDIDDVIRPYEHCDKYQEEVKEAPAVENAVAEFASTDEYLSVQNAVQNRLGISTQLSAEDIYTLYEICRFYRSWTETKQSPWCSVFSEDDLVVLEYRDDVRHYYRNGYGSWVNIRLGNLALKDLYENFEAAVQGQGRNIISYFTHDTMMEMVFCALGLYRDTAPLQGYIRDADRVWRTSVISAMANNLIAVLYECQDSGVQTYRVQILHNEKVSDICPSAGCTWDEFQEKFRPFTNSTLDFCSLDYPEPEPESESESESESEQEPDSEPLSEAEVGNTPGNAVTTKGMVWILLVQLSVHLRVLL